MNIMFSMKWPQNVCGDLSHNLKYLHLSINLEAHTYNDLDLTEREI